MPEPTDQPAALLHRLAKQVPSSPDADGIHLAAHLLLSHERKHGVIFLAVPTEVLDTLRSTLAEVRLDRGIGGLSSEGWPDLADLAQRLLDLAPSEQSEAT